MSKNNWGKLNSWSFVRELALHILYINQEEADNLLHPKLISVKILVAQDISPATVACRVTHTCQCSGRRQSLRRSKSFLTWTSSSQLSHQNAPHFFACLVPHHPPDSAARVPRESPSSEEWTTWEKQSQCVASSKNAIDSWRQYLDTKTEYCIFQTIRHTFPPPKSGRKMGVPVIVWM